MNAEIKAADIAYMLCRMRYDVYVTPKDVLNKVSGEQELDFYYTMLFFGGSV